MMEVFPNMVARPKWHTEQRNQCKMAIVEEVIQSVDNKVRRVIVAHSTEGGARSRIERPVRKMILLAPAKKQ